MVDTLKYLKKGGRLTPAVAAIGTLLKIKPVLQIQGFKLDQYAKVRKLNDAKTTMINAVKKDLETRFANERAQGKVVLAIAHTENFDEADKFKAEVEEEFGLPVAYVDPLSLSVSCHIGPGALAIACMVIY
jgi:DegV family protein with EDD domain